MDDKISKKAWVILSVLSLLALITMYGETMLIPALPNIIIEYNISYSTSSWILSSFLISGAVMTPIAGKLSDQYGKNSVLLSIIIIYIIGTIIGWLSHNITMLIIARIIQGIGMAMFPVAFGIIRENFPEKKLAIGQGIFSSVFAAGSIIGLAVGATLIEYFNWKFTFLSIIPISIILLGLINRIIKSKIDTITYRHNGNGIDIKGSVILAFIISSFLIALSFLSDLQNLYNQNVLIILSLFGLSILLSPLLVTIEKRSEHPILDIDLLREKILFPNNILIMTIGILILMIYQTLPILIQSPLPLGFGGTPIDVANVQLPFMILTLIISVISGFVISRLGNIKPTILGGIITLVGFILLFLDHSTLFIISFYLSIISVGLAFLEVGSFNIALVSVSINKSGTSLGITVLLFMIGMSMGPVISGLFLESHQAQIIDYKESFPNPMAYNLIFITLVVISLISLILTIAISNRTKYQHKRTKLNN